MGGRRAGTLAIRLRNECPNSTLYRLTQLGIHGLLQCYPDFLCPTPTDILLLGVIAAGLFLDRAFTRAAGALTTAAPCRGLPRERRWPPRATQPVPSPTLGPASSHRANICVVSGRADKMGLFGLILGDS